MQSCRTSRHIGIFFVREHSDSPETFVWARKACEFRSQGRQPAAERTKYKIPLSVCGSVWPPRNFGPYLVLWSKFLSSFRYFCVRAPPENACSVFANMICYRQSRNILLNRIGHGVFGYSLRFSHFYGNAILNYLLEFFFAWTPNYQHKGIPEW